MNDLPLHVREPDPSIYLGDNYVVIDFETTNHDKGDPDREDNRILIGGYGRGRGIRFDVHCEQGNEFELESMRAAIEEADFIVAHNVKFELGWLRRCGYDIFSKPVFCTQIGQFVLEGNQGKALNLEACLSRNGLRGKEDVVGRMIKCGIPTEEIPRKWLLEYCAIDVRQTWKLFLKQRELLRMTGKLPLVFTKCLLTPILVEVEKRGMFLDRERVEESYESYVRSVDSLQIEFDELTGGINSNSPKQKAEFIYETLKFKVPRDYRRRPLISEKSGLPKTNAEALSLLVPRTPKQKRFVALYKELNNKKQSLQKYLLKLKQCVDDAGGILKGSIGQTFTQTQRLQSNGRYYRIQLQNIPRDFKRLFRAREDGWRVGERDYSSLEFRIAAHLGNDEGSLRDLREGFDPHSLSAGVIFRDEWSKDSLEPEHRKRIRTAAKAHTFKPLFGGSSGTKAQQEYYAVFRRRYPGITGAQESWKQEVLRTGKLRLSTGLEFFWPGTKISSSGYVDNTTKICNYPIQNFAGEVFMIGVVYHYHEMARRGMESFLTNMVHDSIICEVHPEEVELYDKVSKMAMEKRVPWYLKKVYGIEMLTDLTTDVIISTHWAEQEKE